MENLRISTMTAVCKISEEIKLDNLYNSIEINDVIKYVQYKSDISKGYSEKALKKTRKKTVRKMFFNQITMHIFNEKLINVKVFNNGKIQMTGLKNPDQGKGTIDILIKELSKLNNKETPIFEGDLNISDYDIVLINSDFDIKYRVNRDILHREIINIGMYSSYEPTIYPGVNIKYFYNNINEAGVCNCSSKCNGKGSGKGDGDCKKITIAVFNSGKIIITGGNSFDQVLISYEFINSLLSDKIKYENIITNDDIKNNNKVKDKEIKYQVKLK